VFGVRRYANAIPESIRFEVGIAHGQKASMQDMDRLGRQHYRCHVGHAYGADMTSLALDDNLRRALGSALRALEERSALTERLRKQASERGHDQSAGIWAHKIEEIEKETEVLRKTITRIDGVLDRAA
jgi:two-component system chemotaxis response regulator CheB